MSNKKMMRSNSFFVNIRTIPSARNLMRDIIINVRDLDSDSVAISLFLNIWNSLWALKKKGKIRSIYPVFLISNTPFDTWIKRFCISISYPCYWYWTILWYDGSCHVTMWVIWKCFLLKIIASYQIRWAEKIKIKKLKAVRFFSFFATRPCYGGAVP